MRLDSRSSSSSHQRTGSEGVRRESSLRALASLLMTVWEMRVGQETKDPDEEQGEEEVEDLLEDGDDINPWMLPCPTLIVLMCVGVCCSS